MGTTASIIGLGMAVLKLILQLAEKDEAISVVDGVISISDICINQFEKRKGERRLESIADQISAACKSVLDNSKITTERQVVIIEDMINIVNHVDLSFDKIVSIRANSTSLQRIFEGEGKSKLADYDPEEQDLCKRLFNHIANSIIKHALETIEFGNTATIQLLENLDSLENRIEEESKKINEIERVIKSGTSEKSYYEAQYRTKIVNRYDSITVFGANSLTRDEKKYSLDVGYISLELSDHTNSISLQKAVQTYKTIWLTGEAGSGKSTLLQWLAVNYARNSIAQQTGDRGILPILIELRNTDPKDFSLPKAIDRIMADEDIHPPEGWLSSHLNTGSVILLFDGVDEVKREYRDGIIEWINELRKNHPKIRMVITSRPQVEKRIDGKLTEITILPMTREKIDEYIDYWHEAVLIKNLKLDRIEVESCKSALRSSLIKNESIRKITSNPLLCAMICALHYNNGNIRSTNKNELYEDCCKMLLSTRDEDKSVPAYSEMQLSYQEKKSILAKFAYWVMKNGISVATTDEFYNKIKQSLESFDSSKQNYPVEVLGEYFIERSGLLQTPEIDHLEFIHRSFLEYLTAFEISREDDWGFLSQHADDDSWLEILVLSMFFANQMQAESVLNTILKSCDSKHTIVAATCATNAISLSAEVRSMIEERLSSIIPPHSYSESLELAKIGNAVTPFLVHNPKLSSIQHSFCLDTLYHINTSQALRVAFTYLVPSATEEAIDTLGNKLTYYPANEIREAGISALIKSYIRDKAESRELLTSDYFLNLLHYEDMQILRQYFEKIQKLSIFNYENINTIETYNMFLNLVDLTVVGDFGENSILEPSAKTLDRITLCNYNEEYDLYSLNDTNILPQAFYIHSNAPVYFSGADLGFLQNVEALGVYLYNPNAELIFDDITQLKHLERLSVFGPFLCDNWDSLVQKLPNTELEFLVQNEYEKTTMESEFREFGRFSGRTNIKVEIMTFPYGDLRMR